MADSRYGDRQGGYRRRDSIFDDDDRGGDRGGRGSEGGFFQRAGEEVRSWFSDDEDDRGRSRGQGQGSRSDYGAYQGGRSSADRRETWGGGNGWGAGQAGGRGSSQEGRGSSTFDDHYMSWRERQIRQLDQDYQEYCRDRQKQFETEFHGWRQSRQGQEASQGAGQSAGQSGATPDQTGVTSGRTGMEGQRAGSGSTTGMGEDQESSAATTSGGGGEASATESSTGSSGRHWKRRPHRPQTPRHQVRARTGKAPQSTLTKERRHARSRQIRLRRHHRPTNQ
jgi:hypothetical protein